MKASLHIGELRVRVPGLTREQGRQLGEALAQRLKNLKVEQSQAISALKVTVPAGAFTSVARLANEIVASIHSKLQ